jgi:ribonucleoside-diphosphate reductase alpha chain
MITHIQRRTGEIVPFNGIRIKDAIFAAAQSVGGHNEEMAENLSEIIVQHLNNNFDQVVPNIEEIQDIVETALVENGHAKTARAYIIYRAKQSGYREKEKDLLLEKMKKHEVSVTLENGEEAPFDMEKIIKSVSVAADNLKKVDVEVVVLDACRNLYSGVKISEIEKAVINSAKSKIENHPEYSQLSARLLLQGMCKEVFGHSVYEDVKEMNKLYETEFEKFISYGVENKLLHKEMQKFDLKKISAAIKPERDLLFQYLGAQTIYDRYLLKTVTRPQSIIELPQWMWMRVAMGLSMKEEEYQIQDAKQKQKSREDWAIEFYNTLSQMHLISSTPTLFNSGTTHSQMSSCYLNTVDDHLSHIFKVFGDCAQLSKWAGGIGTSWTRVRATNSFIKGTNGASQGIIPFLKIFNDTALAVNQGGKRKGAMCAYMEVWHGDFEEFMEAKKNTGDDRRRLHDINTACWIPDLFMKRMKENKKWTFFSPNEVPELHDLYGEEFEKKYEEYEKANLPSAKTVEALGLWRKMLTMLYETGHPWITFKDAMNVRNPQSHDGVIHSSNLCTEIALNTSNDETAVCNLASINLSKMVKNGKLDEKKIEDTARIGMRMLDNVIDNNFYPTEEAKNSNMRHRPVGLGMMGYQDALYQMDISFDSEDSLTFADESTEMVSYYAILASSELAKERGAYSSYKGSKWSEGVFPYDTVDLYENVRKHPIIVNRQQKMDWSTVKDHVKKNGMRNCCTMAIAPTATISNIAGTTPCIEPTYKNIYMKENLSGSFVVINRYLVADLEKLGLWNEDMALQLKYYNGSVQEIEEVPDHLKNKYKETFEIEPEWIINSAARRSKWIDQAASTNVFLKTTSGKVLNDTYVLAWEAGLKTTYYLRTLAESQVTKTIELKKKEVDTQPAKSVKEASAPEVAAAPANIYKMEELGCESCQ